MVQRSVTVTSMRSLYPSYREKYVCVCTNCSGRCCLSGLPCHWCLLWSHYCTHLLVLWCGLERLVPCQCYISVFILNPKSWFIEVSVIWIGNCSRKPSRRVRARHKGEVQLNKQHPCRRTTTLHHRVNHNCHCQQRRSTVIHRHLTSHWLGFTRHRHWVRQLVIVQHRSLM